MKKTKSYDQLNNYDFIIRYFMKICVNTKYEDSIEITEDIFLNLESRKEEIHYSNIEIYKKYYVGFYKNSTSYITQEVMQEVYFCLKETQNYEKNKVKHERERHIDVYFEQERLNKIPSKINYEEKALDKVVEQEIKEFLESKLNKKQCRRFYRNKIKDIPLVVIAKEENTDPASICKSVMRAKKKIKKFF